MPIRGLGQGEYAIQLRVIEGTTVHREWREPLSLVPRAASRLRALEAQLPSFQGRVNDFEWHSVRHWLQIVSETLAGATPETNYPIGRLLVEAEQAIAQWQQGRRWWANQPGDHWVSARYNEAVHYFRLFVPSTTSSEPRPLVIALHGAGGNEHLFFEGYGLGRVLTEAARRGWYVLAPRAGNRLDHVWAALELAYAHLNVDRNRVLLIGHSMGGFQTFAAALQRPTAFAGIAVYAAGSNASLTPLRDKPMFLAVGAQESAFLRATVQNTREALQRLDPCCFQYKEYAPCEHLMIVREALPDSFAFLERQISRSSEVGRDAVPCPKQFASNADVAVGFERGSQWEALRMVPLSGSRSTLPVMKREGTSGRPDAGFSILTQRGPTVGRGSVMQSSLSSPGWFREFQAETSCTWR
ncbi:MAG: alpha/beta fold hydrolase [Acidobacteriota bacterium]|nr:alpha/beta fold hydrolase [Acidobacteriota bacterium]